MTSNPPPVAVVGLYNSGSSCVAGLLHHLGYDMGSPFWTVPRLYPVYEPYDLSAVLRQVWKEPYGQTALDAETRAALLRNWLLLRKSLGSQRIGAKHPLLSLSLPELHAAWGSDTKVVWVRRDLQESVRRLQERGWFGDYAKPLQLKLWRSIEANLDFDTAKTRVIDWQQLRSNPAESLESLIGFLDLSVSEQRFNLACHSVKTGG